MAEKKVQLVELKVTVDNHTHQGKPVEKGAAIQVDPEVKEMLERQWAERAKEAEAK